MKKLLLALSIIYIVLELLDLYTTWIGLGLGAYEIMPVLKFVNDSGITFAVVFLKLIGVFLGIWLFYFAYKLRTEWRGKVWLGALISVILYLTVVVINNTLVIMRLS